MLFIPFVLISIGTILFLTNGVFCKSKNQAEQQVNTNEKEKQLALLQKEKEQLEQETADWLVYRNEEFGYQLKYPNGWKVIEARPGKISEGESNDVIKKCNEGELHKAVFLEKEYEKVQGNFSVTVKSNKENFTIDEKIEKSGYDEFIGGSKIYNLQIDNQPVKKVVINWDYEQELIVNIILYQNYFYYLVFDGRNYEDPEEKIHQQIYSKMFKTFKFLK